MITTVVFDVGETLVDETRAWTTMAQAAGVTPLTLFGALGALIDRGEDHRQVWDLLGGVLHQGRGGCRGAVGRSAYER